MKKTYKLIISLTAFVTSLVILIFAIIFITRANTSDENIKSIFYFNKSLKSNEQDISDTSYFKSIKVDEISDKIYIQNVHMGTQEVYVVKAPRAFIDSLSTTRLNDIQKALTHDEGKISPFSLENKTRINKPVLITTIILSSLGMLISFILMLEMSMKKEIKVLKKFIRKWNI